MKAVIMAGGQGTRLRPLTYDRPKPLVPIANRPVLEHLVRLLRQHGFDEIYLTTHYLPDHIERALGDGSRFGVRLHYAIEPSPLGTAGAVKRAAAGFGETFLVMSGDCLTDFDLTEAVRRHRRTGALATMVVTEVEDPSQYGIVAFDEVGRIERFLEKPKPREVFSRTANAGIYVLEPEALDPCPTGEPFDFSKHLFPKLLASGAPLFTFLGDGYWSDIGNCVRYIQSQRDALAFRVKLPAMPPTKTPGVWIHPTARVHASATLVPPVMIGMGAEIQAGSRVGPGTVLGDECRIELDAVVEGSVVLEAVRVGPRSVLKGAAVGSRAVIEAGARLMEGAAVGDRARIRAAQTVLPGAKVWAAANAPSALR